MALQALSASELAASPTLFKSFMGESDTTHKTVGQLHAIYSNCRATLTAAEAGDHLRVDRFAADMAARRWTGDVVLRLGVFDDNVLVIDGIHRGIAYLGCIERGLHAARLPALRVEC
jgi:hypothetical protein